MPPFETLLNQCSDSLSCRLGGATLAVLALGLAALFFIPHRAPPHAVAFDAPSAKPSVTQAIVVAIVTILIWIVLLYRLWW